MMMTMYAAVAQQEALNISMNTAWAYRSRALQGNPKFRRLYGYRVVGRGKEQMLEPVPDEVEVVKGVFTDFTSGTPIMDIAHRLSKAGIPTVRNRSTWTGKAIRNMLLNVKYTGNTRVVKTPSNWPSCTRTSRTRKARRPNLHPQQPSGHH
jgi:site-specific DNA recombinase